MSAVVIRWFRSSLSIQLLALCFLTLLATQAISLALVFSRPAPTPDYYKLDDILRAYRGDASATANHGALKVFYAAGPPGPPLDGRREIATRNRLAAKLHIPASDVVFAGESLPFLDRRVVSALRRRIAEEGLREDELLVAPFQIGLRQADGRWFVMRTPRFLGLEAWQQRMVLLFLLSGLAMVPVTLVFARRLSAPIGDFAKAAEGLGRNPDVRPLAERGPAEVAQAVRAFNAMQERLHRYVHDRTAMVAAIAHDLRTPLTRLRFRVEAVPEDQRARMIADLEEMEQMIAAALAFVRDASSPAVRASLELSSLVGGLCDEMSNTGSPTQVERSDRVVLTGDPIALRRLFANLLDNAVKFGGAARARVIDARDTAIVEIDDDGPGIPATEVERVFEPFYRREPSRSRQTGGAGLGLAVVRSIARAHGGDVALINRGSGGLTVRVELPV